MGNKKTARKMSNTIEKTSSAFKPLIASSLVLVLGVSVAIASENSISVGSTSSVTDLNWTSNGNYRSFSFSSGNSDQNTRSLESVQIEISGSNSVVSTRFRNRLSDTSDPFARADLDFAYGTTQATVNGNTYGLKIGASGTGTLYASLWNSANTSSPITITLDLSNASSEYALWGNFYAKKTGSAGEGIFKGLFGAKGIKGNVTLDLSGNDEVNQVGLGTANLTFKSGAGITGGVNVKNNGVYNIIFEGAGTIGGNLNFSSGSATTKIQNLSTLSGELQLVSGSHAITFSQTSGGGTNLASDFRVSGGTTTINGVLNTTGGMLFTSGANASISFSDNISVTGRRFGNTGQSTGGSWGYGLMIGPGYNVNTRATLKFFGNESSISTGLVRFGSTGNLLVSTDGSTLTFASHVNEGTTNITFGSDINTADKSGTLNFTSGLSTSYNTTTIKMGGTGTNTINGKITANGNNSTPLVASRTVISMTSTESNKITGILKTMGEAASSGQTQITLNGSNDSIFKVFAHGGNHDIYFGQRNNTFSAAQADANYAITGKIYVVGSSVSAQSSTNTIVFGATTSGSATIGVQTAGDVVGTEGTDIIVAGSTYTESDEGSDTAKGSNYKATNNITFKGSGNNSIYGNIVTLADSYTIGNPAENIILFEAGNNSITGNVDARAYADRRTTITVTMNGSSNTINGNILGAGLNNIYFKTTISSSTNIINGNVIAQGGRNTVVFGNNGANQISGHVEATGGTNDISFYNTSTSSIISGRVSSTGGSNIINFSSTPPSVSTSVLAMGVAATNQINAGVVAKGYGSRTNTINVVGNGDLEIGTLSGQSEGDGYSIYTHNGGGNTNTISVSSGTLTTTAGIRSNLGTNTISAQNLVVSAGGISSNGDGGGNPAINSITVTNSATINGGIQSNNASSKNYIGAQTLIINGNISTNNGGSKNVIYASGNGGDTSTFGSEGSAISISAGNGQNIISLGSSTNTLTLSNISVGNVNGRNYIAKATASSNNLVSGFESNWANTSSYQASGVLSTTEGVGTTNGKNFINIATIKIGGEIDANGETAVNNIASNDLTTVNIRARWGGTNNLIALASLAIKGNINSGEGNNSGNNFIYSNTQATIGEDQSAITISSNNGKNVLSLSGTNNTLVLSSVSTTNNGKNYIGKEIVDGATSGNLTLKSALTTDQYLSDARAFEGKLSISDGVSGNNTISFKAGGVDQASSIISKVITSEELGVGLGTAVSGSNNLYLDVSASSIGSGVDAIQQYFAALGGTGTIEDAQKQIINSSVIVGNIDNLGTTNIKIVGTQNTITRTGQDKAQVGILGNINNQNGTTNIVLQDAFFAPSELIVPSVDVGQSVKNVAFGQKEAGNITTASGATTNLITRFTNPIVNPSGISVYGIKGAGTTNVVIQGDVDVGTHMDYVKGSHVNLIFANASSGDDSFDTKTNIDNNQVLGVAYQNGVKLSIADRNILIGDKIASFLDTYSSYYTDGSTPLATIWANRTSGVDTVAIEGLVVGNIANLGVDGSVTSKTYNVTLSSGSAFAGNISLNSSTTTAINIVMEENSKLILSDSDDSNSSDLFVISNLNIKSGAVDQYQLQKETLKQTNNVINIATGGAGANNVATRENFRLLAVGNTETNGASKGAENTGLYGNGAAVFMTYVNTHADQNSAILGNQASNNGSGQYGNAYSDRIIIANVGDNSKAQSETYYMQFAVDADSKLNSVTYNASNDKNTSGGGTKTAGNIAVLTVVNTDDNVGKENKAGITLKTQDVLQGFDRIGGDLIAVETDITGEAGTDKTGYTTYFINALITRGATEATQDVTASAFATNYDLYFANFNSLNKRMGELRDNDNSQGAWARIFNGSQSNDFTKSKSTYTTFQGGYDYAFGFEGANNYLGVAVSYAMSSSKSDLNALDITGATKNIDNIKSNAVEVALYNSYVQDEGWYNDTIAKFSYIFSDFTITGQESKYNTTNMAFTLSDEFGYRFKLGSEKEWYIDPQLEVALGYFNQSDFIQTLGLSSLEGVADGIITMRSRFGSSFGYDFKKFTANKPIKASVYVGAFYEYDYINGGDVTLTTNLGGVTTSSSAISSDGRVVMNVGTNMTIKDNTRIYFDFESSFAGKINTDYQVNVGVRYSFGENTGYTPMTVKKEVAPLKVSEEKTEESKEVENTENNTQEKSTENKTEEKKAQ